jgi:GntR family transcriptional repressor for pyruvate dehydrogenase complex
MVRPIYHCARNCKFTVKVTTQKVSDQVAERLEKLILDGTLPAGAKLVSERDLASDYGVSRPSVRDAIKKLEAQGLVTRKQGDGTFVTKNLNDPFAEPLFELLAKSPDSHYDLLEFRFALEGVTSYYAALRGTSSELDDIRHAFYAIEQLSDSDDLDRVAEAVVKFYLAVADASHNVMLLHLLRGLKDLLIHNVKENLVVFQSHSEIRAQLKVHRTELMEAIVNGEPEQARQANRRHLAYIEKSLLALDEGNNKLQGSVRRLLSGGKG